MKTYIPEPEVSGAKKWFVVDAAGQVLGRLASKVATVLMGKNKAIYTAHVDVGDYVIVVNASKVRVTGAKATDKIYYRHSGFPGGIKARTFTEQMKRDSTKVIRLAVRNMLPKSILGRGRLSKLKVYAGDEHPHDAQMPEPMTLGGKW